MQQIKFFKGIENQLTELEGEVNRWLVESGAEVVQVFGNMSPQSPSPADGGSGLSGTASPPSDVFIAIVYEKV